MTFFVCLLDPLGKPVPSELLAPYEMAARKRGVSFASHALGNVSVLIAGDRPGDESLVAACDGHLAVGVARLDNRAECRRRVNCDGQRLSDLDLVVRMVGAHGEACVPRLLGDFAFVVWSWSTGNGLAACDPFAVKKLFFAQRGALWVFASRGELLSLTDQYDAQYLAELVAFCSPSPGRNAYADVGCLPAGTLATVDRGRLVPRPYWSAGECQAASPTARSECEAVDLCRQLIAEAVGHRLTGRRDTWAELSGGLDSSSVVGTAQSLAMKGNVACGLTGTVTWVDSHGTGADEREYSDEVAEHWRLLNETIVDTPIWQDDGLGPPRVDQPGGTFALYARERRLCCIVRRAGGEVLLTGRGGDELFTGNMFFFADWLMAGRVRPALREMVSRATTGRVSFWDLGFRNALLPLLPKAVQRHLLREEGQVPPWVTASIARRYELHSRASAASSYAGRIGRKYSDAMAGVVASIPTSLTDGVLEETLDVRHPFLYRPLVEFALQLTPDLCVRPQARKWILREAMRGILPEVVRARVGKGLLYGLLGWSLVSQRATLEPLVRAPILTDLGIVDGAKLRACFDAARYERDRPDKLAPALQHTLAIEAWLEMRSGRWPVGSRDEGYGSSTIDCSSKRGA
jgi:asparagine synthase (glutamine-hydrolysing)